MINQDVINPIFIVGAPRSGTSLIRVILNRHPEIGICDETYFFYYVYSRRNKFGDLKNIEWRRKLVNRYLATDRIHRLDLDLQQLSDTLMEQGISYEAFFLSLMWFYAKSNGKRRFGEKTPQHALYAEKLIEMFPDCKLIHVIRDPRDVIASLMRMPWASKSVLANARIWRACNMSAYQCNKKGAYLAVQYEKLVLNPDEELKRICTFIGEEYVPSMLVPEGQSNPNGWWFERAHKVITQKRIGAWEDILDSKDIRLIEWITGPYMQQFGYEPIEVSASGYAKILALGIEIFDNLSQKIASLPRIWYELFQPTELAKVEALIDARSTHVTRN